MPSEDLTDHQRSSHFVLIIASTPDYRLLMQYAMLTSVPQARTTFARTVEEALDYLRDCFDHQNVKPRLVLLELSSIQSHKHWTLLAHLKHRFPGLPVVGLASALNPSAVERAYALGANAVMAVPTQLEDWVQQFRMLGEYWFESVLLPTG